MIVKLKSGEMLIVDYLGLTPEHQKSLGTVVHNCGAALDFRFPSIVDGSALNVFVRADQVSYIALADEEIEALEKALTPPERKPPVKPPADAGE